MEVDLVELSGIELTDDERDRLWDDISPRELLLDWLGCAEIDIYEVESGPGMSDTWYEYHCGDKEEFIRKLAAALLEIK